MASDASKPWISSTAGIWCVPAGNAFPSGLARTASYWAVLPQEPATSLCLHGVKAGSNPTLGTLNPWSEGVFVFKCWHDLDRLFP
jgi:hypothetical protein